MVFAGIKKKGERAGKNLRPLLFIQNILGVLIG